MKICPLIFYEAPTATKIDDRSREELILDEEVDNDDHFRAHPAEARQRLRPFSGDHRTLFLTS
jgi:hypothetical protein